MDSYKVVDADAHMCEPPSIWAERLDEEFKARAPKVIKDFNGQKGEFFVIDKQNNMRVAGVFAAGKTFDEKFMELALDSALPGGSGPANAPLASSGNATPRHAGRERPGPSVHADGCADPGRSEYYPYAYFWRGTGALSTSQNSIRRKRHRLGTVPDGAGRQVLSAMCQRR